MEELSLSIGENEYQELCHILKKQKSTEFSLYL